jgi:hypothetical protein
MWANSNVKRKDTTHISDSLVYAKLQQTDFLCSAIIKPSVMPTLITKQI